MNKRNRLVIIAKCVALIGIFGLSVGALAQSTIAYFPNSPTEVDYWYAWALNPDNWGDFYISAGPISGTFGPTSNTYTFPFTFGTYGSPDTNEFLTADYVTLLTTNSQISDSPPNGSSWTSPGQEVPLTTEFAVQDSTNTTAVWSGPLALIGDGYIGIRFLEVDGWHYGWIHVSLPPLDVFSGLIVLDSAYNLQGDAPIVPGAKPLVIPQRTLGLSQSGNMRVQWVSNPGTTYQVQFKDDLNVPLWTNIGSTVIATTTNCTTDLPTVMPTRFYRVVKAN